MYWRITCEPVGGGLAEPKRASIGVPGAQFVFCSDPAVKVPWSKAVHPSDGELDPSGLTHETCTHSPARAAAGTSLAASPTSKQRPTSDAHEPAVHLLLTF